MKYLRTFCLFAVLCIAMNTLAFSQAAATPAPSPAPQPQTAPAPPATISAIVDRQVSQYEKLMVEAAEAMPEDKFNFSPESLSLKGSEFKGVRTFATLIKHTASANFRFWTALSGDKF